MERDKRVRGRRDVTERGARKRPKAKKIDAAGGKLPWKSMIGREAGPSRRNALRGGREGVRGKYSGCQGPIGYWAGLT